ncbi:MAG TPA: hypothetical protein VFK20_07590 [Vicinamibacterales bacterium]|nr:hypothetical protein [Vicinamibacterales bacterium]
MSAAPRTRRLAARAPMLALGIASLVWGMWLGLLRVGWRLPLPWPDQLIAHGPLMVCGFLGTLITLERAVGLGARWGYAAPIASAAGALLLLVDAPIDPPRLLFTASAAVLVIIFAAALRRQPSLFTAVMGVGAAAWLAGNAYWASGASIIRVVPWWIAFLVLTIAGERLELNRLLRPTTAVRIWFVSAAGIIAAGAIVSRMSLMPGTRLLGAGIVLMAAWLARHDIARRTVHQRGLTRFMAVCLLAGYAWLALGGGIAIVTGAATSGVVYDAVLHAIFLGFVISMIFAHAPVIFPAVLGVPMRYRASFYAHLGLLHASVAIRLAGDFVEPLARWRSWGAMLNVAALLLFLAATIRSVFLGGGSAGVVAPAQGRTAARAK